MGGNKGKSGRREGDVLKGLAAGVIGGPVASWTMNRFQAAWGKLSDGTEKPHGAQSLQRGSPQGSGRHVALRLRADGS